MLIAVGTGFHHMTGKENIYLNGTILGMSRKEIDAKFNEIVDFADIGDYLEAPVSTYSSGMTVRLGFSIAVHCEPDILLVDEVLSVGDLSFRNKSMRKMDEFRKKANALIFISHNLDQIRVLCDRVIIMDKGKIIFDGNTDEGLINYENQSKDLRVSSINKSSGPGGLFRERRSDGERVIFHNIGLVDAQGNETSELNIDDPLQINLDFTINEHAASIYFTISVLNEKRNVDCIWVKSNDRNKFIFDDIKPEKYRMTVRFSKHHLAPGVYFINYAVRNGHTGEIFDHGFTDVSFSVKSDQHFERGIILTLDEWTLNSLQKDTERK